MVAAPSGSSALADKSQQKGQAALFALSRGRKEGEVEGDVIPWCRRSWFQCLSRSGCSQQESPGA